MIDAIQELLGNRELVFEWPWLLLLGLLLPALWVRGLVGGRAKLAHSAASRLSAVGRTWRVRLAWLPSALRGLALLLLVVALARPQERTQRSETTVNGIALQVVVDRSGSMDEPTVFDGEQMNRLEAVKQVVAEFVAGNDRGLEGRSGDLIGLIAFGSFADTLCPLVRSYEPLLTALEKIEIPRLESEQGTAIGDALALAAARLQSAETEIAASESKLDSFKIKGKAIVLLTDGEDRSSQIDPAVAAGLAADWGIKVYIIGIRGGVSSALGGRRVVLNEVNEQMLSTAAERTGGRFWPVDSIEQLRDVYREIDLLEKTEIEVDQELIATERFDLAVWPAAALILLDLILGWTLFRRWPG